jgi:transposase
MATVPPACSIQFRPDRSGWPIEPSAHGAGRPTFNAFLYRYWNLVQRFFSKLKHFRAVTTRYAKHASNDLALVKRAPIRIWLRHNGSVF